MQKQMLNAKHLLVGRTDSLKKKSCLGKVSVIIVVFVIVM